MTETEAVSRFCQVRSQALKGAFRRGFRWQRSGGERLKNPYTRYRDSGGWGRQCWNHWEEGWRVADRYGMKEEVSSGRRS